MKSIGIWNHSLPRVLTKKPPTKDNHEAITFTIITMNITDVITNNDKLLEILRDNIRSIETQLDKLREEQISKNTFFKVEVLIQNFS